jgi:hypothetical protein
METQSTTVYRLSDLQIDELRIAFRYSQPFCPGGIIIHRIGFDDKGGVILELENGGELQVIRIGPEDKDEKISTFIFKKN